MATSTLLSQLGNALKRTPGNIAGGGADLANLISGVVAGRGLQGLVDAPVGGSKQLNAAFGLQEPAGSAQETVEALLSMLNPGAAVKAAAIPVGASLVALAAAMAGAKPGAKIATGPGAKQAGVIVPGSPEIAKLLGIESIVDRALDMFKSGKSQHAIGIESEKSLAAARNPGEALSIFIGPDGIPRIKLDTKNARIASTAPVTAPHPGGSLAELDKSVLAAPDEVVGPAVPLSDYLLHPSLYDISPLAAQSKVSHGVLADLFGHKGEYDAVTNNILVPKYSRSVGRTVLDPMGDFLETLLHESNHVVQVENKLRGGANTSVAGIEAALASARTLGSFRTPAQLDQVGAALKRLKAAPDSGAKDAALTKLYMNVYGEWEARQGSQYGRSLPMMNERGSTF